MKTFLPQSQQWNFKHLLFWNSLALILMVSLFIPPITTLWRDVDIAFFRWINQPLKHSSFLRVYYALANHHLADWFEDLCILGFYFAAVHKVAKEKRRERIAEIIFCIFLIAATIFFINRLLCRDFLRLRRASPSLVIPNSVSLVNYINWIHIKSDSAKSFPGDHATAALMFACSYAYLVRGKLAICALVYGLLLCLPRLAVGAHWLSDIIIGSGAIIFVVLSWTFCTPFAGKCIALIQSAMEKIRRKKPINP